MMMRTHQIAFSFTYNSVFTRHDGSGRACTRCEDKLNTILYGNGMTRQSPYANFSFVAINKCIKYICN